MIKLKATATLMVFKRLQNRYIFNYFLKVNCDVA